MPDVTFGPDTTGQPDYPIFVFPPLLPFGRAVGILPGFIRSTSFKLRPSIPKLALTVVPFTIAVAKPGLLHVVLDAAFYTGSHLAIEALRNWADADRKWSDRTQDEIISDSVSAWVNAHPEILGPGGRLTIIVEYPPAHLVDP